MRVISGIIVGLFIAFFAVVVSFFLFESTGVVDTGDAVNDIIGAALGSLIIGFFAWIFGGWFAFIMVGNYEKKKAAKKDSS